VKRLLDTGVSLQQIRVAVTHLRDRGVDDLAEITLMSDGASVYECTSPDEVIDLVQGGQGVFGIAVGRVWRGGRGHAGGDAGRAPGLRRRSSRATSCPPGPQPQRRLTHRARLLDAAWLSGAWPLYPRYEAALRLLEPRSERRMRFRCVSNASASSDAGWPGSGGSAGWRPAPAGARCAPARGAEYQRAEHLGELLQPVPVLGGALAVAVDQDAEGLQGGRAGAADLVDGVQGPGRRR
jgi:hypothetical protein